MTYETGDGGTDHQNQSHFDQVADMLLARLDFISAEANEAQLFTLSGIMSMVEKLMEEREGLDDETRADVEFGIVSQVCCVEDMREQLKLCGIAGTVEDMGDHVKVNLFDITAGDADRLVSTCLDHVEQAIGKGKLRPGHIDQRTRFARRSKL